MKKPIRFRITSYAVFGDSINNTDTVPAVFECEDQLFSSPPPRNRAAAAALNLTMTKMKESITGEI